MRKKYLAVMMSMALALSAVGCGNSAGVQPEEEDSTKTEVQNETEQAAASKPEAAGTETDYSEQEPYTVKIVICDEGTPEAVQAVEEAANEITVPKFNTTIDLQRLGFGEWQEQIELMLASGEKIDLMMVSWISISDAARNGQILPMNDLLETYGQDILADVSESDWACSRSDGEIYGVRNNKELACGYGVAMRTDILETLDFDVSTIHTEADLTELLRLVKENYPDVYPIVSDYGTMGNNYLNAIDWLGTENNFGVLENALNTESTDVVDWWTSETFQEICSVRHQWVEEGLMMPDPTINSEGASSLMAAGKAFCYLTDTKPGIESQWERNTGTDITVVNVVTPFSVTNNLNNKWYIPYTSEEPARAMQILNEMYSNPELANIFIYGVEGVHYQVVDAENGVVDYAEGVDAANSPYKIDSWAWPNELIAYKWISDGADIWEETIRFNEEAIQSPAKGFTFDSSQVENETVACSAVLEKYRNGLNTGELDPEAVIPQMAQELEAAGVSRILEEKQRQLDAWLAESDG